MLSVSFRTKQDKTELSKTQMTVTSVAVATTRSLFGMHDYKVDNDVLPQTAKPALLCLLRSC